MRRAALRTILSFAATAMAAQIATGIHLQEVYFRGDTRLEGVDLEKCADDLKSKDYEGPEWTEDLMQVVRTQCLVEKGYLKAVVKASIQQLPDENSTHQFVITFDIHAGPLYRLGHITFNGNQARMSDTKALRRLFPVNDGSIVDHNGMAEGLENLRLAYQEMGYINFVSIPIATFDDAEKVLSLEIDVDEGKQFRVSTIDILGADVQVLNDLRLKPGEVYNEHLVNLFLRKHLPGADANDPRMHRVLDERNGTVALTFDFRTRTE